MMYYFSSRNSLFLPFILSFFVFLIVLGSHPFFYTVNKNLQNTYYQIKEILFDKSANPNIVIVEIDEKTLQKLGAFPFSRENYIPVIQNLSKASVGVIGFDIIFSDKKGEKEDILFSESISKAGNIILGNALSNEGNIIPVLPVFASGALTSGYFAPLIDSATDTVYSLTPYRLESGKTYFHFSIALVKAYFSRIFGENYFSLVETKKGYFSVSDKLFIPYTPSGTNQTLISYIQPKKFKRFSFVDIYDSTTFEIFQKTFDFKDKIIIIGTTSKGIKDIFYTPKGVEYGVYIHANMVNTILQKDFIVYFDTRFEWALVFLLIFLLVFFNLSRSPFVLIVSNIILFFVFIIILPIFIITYTNIVMNYPSEIILAFITSFTVGNLVKYLIENKEKSRLNKALSEYVSKDIAEEILSGEGKVHLDGEKKYVTIFFSDIQGFTTLSEAYSPEGLMVYLRQYIRRMSDIIIDKRGFISKYEGDAIVALWGTFGHQNTMHQDACMTALKQQEDLKEFNREWKEKGFPEVRIRIGIHAGDVIVGNIGTPGRKLEFTALGDAMNLGSRLEGVNKVYGTQICVSEVIFTQEKTRFEFRFLDTIRAKGKKNAIRIYELLGEKGKVSSEERKNMLDFEKAIELYIKKDFKTAFGIFEVLSSLGDMPSKTYMLRCKYLLENPPLSAWDGVWEMTEK